MAAEDFQEQALEHAIEIEARVGAPEQRLVLASRMLVDDAYQRRPDPKRILSMANNWSDSGMGVLYVSERDPDVFAIIDGQHRKYAYCAKCGDKVDPLLPCMVYRGLTIKDEAWLFWLYNSGENRRPMTSLDVFRSRLAWGDERAVQIQEILAQHDMTVARNASAKNPKGEISAIAAMDRVLAIGGPERLGRVVALLKQAYGTDHLAFRAGMIRGMDNFLERYEDHPAYRHTRLVERMSATPLRSFDRVVISMGEFGGANMGNIAARWAQAILLVYNTGLQRTSKTRLPDFDDPAIALKMRARGKEDTGVFGGRAGWTPEERSEASRQAAFKAHAARRARKAQEEEGRPE
jgi:hypothetical protein